MFRAIHSLRCVTLMAAANFLLATATAGCGIPSTDITDPALTMADPNQPAETLASAGGDWLYLPGGQGYISWTWSSNRASLDNVYKVAWDKDCDGEGIYTKIGVTNALNYYKEGPAVSDACAGGYTWTGPSSWRDVVNIKRVRVIVCEDVPGSDECTVRDYYPPS